MLGFYSLAQAGVGMEAKTDRRIQLDHELGESGADSAARSLVAPEDPDAGVGTGADGRRNVSRRHSPPVVLLLLQTCHYQRKDSPVEALTLSPEPLWCEKKEKGKKGRQREAGRNKLNMRGRK